MLDVEVDVRFVDVEDWRSRDARDGREEIEENFESWIENMDLSFPFPFGVKIEPREKEGRGGLTVTAPSFFSLFEFTLGSAFLAFVLMLVFEEAVS